MSDGSDCAEDVDVGAEPTDYARGRGPPPERVFGLDHVYEALAHPRRRYLCYTLLEDTEWSLTALATKVAAWEAETAERAVDDHECDRVYVALYHAHVPKLVDEGIIAFDEATGTITAAENAGQVLAALEGMGASLDAAQETHARREMDRGETTEREEIDDETH
ncbi:DUF7344 domain-containing protein [Halobellus salinisoli]|uniref:DUF7344 domain-containing protein n=1 Tax=Halobellus salinisoli TaxID=3108500 RepID=UPI00300B2F9B